MAKSYLFTEDPGHGWLRVPLKELEPIKDQITPYSYMHGDYAYLEEDCDMAKFLIMKFQRSGFAVGPEKPIVWKTLWDNGTLKTNVVDKTTIRDFEHYHVRTEEEKHLMQVVIETLLKINFRKSAKEKIKKASYGDCQYWQKYYNIHV